MFDKEMLKNILSAFGPSGREETASEVIKGYVAPYADEVYNDRLGNLIAVKKGTSGRKIMYSAHMDQIGLIVTDIDEKGFLRVSNVGGVSPVISIAREVVFKNGTRGVTYFETEKGIKDMTLAQLFIDIGCESYEEAAAKVDVGDMCIFVSNFVEMGNKLSSPYMDDRIACAALVEAFRTMKSEHDIYAVFTVQEEVGLRGAGAAAFAIEPDLNISCDVTGMGDIPNCTRMSVKLGAGATVKAMDSSVIVPVKVREFLKNAADKRGIKWQNEVLRAGGTDTGAAQRAGKGTFSGCVSIPTRYIHAPIETIDIRDYEAAIALMRAAAEEKELPTV
ncbi:MAG: M42 family metallopeptidase [Clostridiales bacterium]|nr:M42 family metallopeptidase [Clostridiales bacterium]